MSKPKLLAISAIILGIFAFSLTFATTYLSVSLYTTYPPAGSYVSVSSTHATTSVFEFRNTSTSSENIILESIKIDNFGSSATIPDTFSGLYLYESGVLLATTTGSVGPYKFFLPSNYVISTSSIKYFIIKVDFGAGATVGESINVGLVDLSARNQQGTSSPIIIGTFPMLANKLFMQ